MRRMRIVSVCLPKGMLEELDRLVKEQGYPGRSEVIRIAVRDMLQQEWKWRRQHK